MGVDPVELNGSGIKERLIRAESAFEKGTHPAIPEANVAATVNSVARKLKAPDFAYTNTPQVRQLRVRLMGLSPKLTTFAPSGGLSDQLRPVEAFYVAGMMIRQKLSNPEFQISPWERHQMWAGLHGTRNAPATKANADPSRSDQLNKVILKNSDQDPDRLIHDALDVLAVRRSGGGQ